MAKLLITFLVIFVVIILSTRVARWRNRK